MYRYYAMKDNVLLAVSLLIKKFYSSCHPRFRNTRHSRRLDALRTKWVDSIKSDPESMYRHFDESQHLALMELYEILSQAQNDDTYGFPPSREWRSSSIVHFIVLTFYQISKFWYRISKLVLSISSSF